MSLDYSEKEAVIFPYKECEILVAGKMEKVWRPMALVSVGRKNFRMEALIDSGSDRTLSYLDPFGYSLGIGDDFEGEPDEIRGLFGTGKAWPTHIDIWIGNSRLNIPIYWITKKFDIETDHPMILGRRIIFDNFDVVFRQKEKKVYFYRIE